VSTSVNNRTSRSLVYGLGMLRLFTAQQPVRGIAELAELMSVSRPTAHRYASTCLELGYLEQAPMRRYRLTRRSAEPGIAMVDSLAVTRRSDAILRELREETGRTVSLAVLDGADVLYLRRLRGFERGQYRLEHGLGVGSRMPARETAAGRALLLAGTDEEAVGAEEAEGSRQRSDEPRTLTVCESTLDGAALGLAIAVPAGREPISAVEVTVPAGAIDPAALTADLGAPLRAAALALQSALVEHSAVNGATDPARSNR
jgi:IclR family transcriptional regulator, pca regulon regulatory protein